MQPLKHVRTAQENPLEVEKNQYQEHAAKKPLQEGHRIALLVRSGCSDSHPRQRIRQASGLQLLTG